ncbi:hypothetical protein HDU84_005497 [Entophlyctis sp. JEL0112]|nr:hypothetical protein HDU84_005497 [Entophlyctis sp. JEL0112]
MDVNKLRLDLFALKLAVLRERVAADIAREAEAQKSTIPNPEPQPPPKPQFGEDLSLLTSRMAALLDHLESSKQNSTQTSTLDMLQQVTLQNAQLHGILMANLLGGSPGYRGNIARTKAAEEIVDASVSSLDVRKPDEEPRKEPAPRTVQETAEEKKNEASGKLQTFNSLSPKHPLKFKIAAISVLFTTLMVAKGKKQRGSVKHTSGIVDRAKVELVTVFKQQKPLSKALELAVALLKDGTSLIFKESFTNPKRRGIAVQEKLIPIGNAVVDAITQMTPPLFLQHFGEKSAVLCIFDYFANPSVAFPEDYLWSVEKKDISSFSVRLGDAKKSKALQQTMALYFVAKVLLLGVLCRLNDSKFVDKKIQLLEANMASVSIFLFKAIMLACGHSEDESKEFAAGLPPGNFKSSWISLPLAAAIQMWSDRFAGWVLNEWPIE